LCFIFIYGFGFFFAKVISRYELSTFQIEVQFLEGEEEEVPAMERRTPETEGAPPHGGTPRVELSI